MIKLNDNEYEIVENVNDCLDKEVLESKYTDYFEPFDYILGDFSYNKLRLKGFCDKNNKRFSKINDISTKDIYIKDLCAYKCNYFLLKKIEK